MGLLEQGARDGARGGLTNTRTGGKGWQGGKRWLVKELLPDATCYFNHPVKNRAAIEAAHHVYDVRHFVIDSHEELAKILACTAKAGGRAADLVIQVRLATAPGYATFDLSQNYALRRHWDPFPDHDAFEPPANAAAPAAGRSSTFTPPTSSVAREMTASAGMAPRHVETIPPEEG